MKAKLITLSLAGAFALGTSALYAGRPGGGGGPDCHGDGPHQMGFGLEHVTKELDLTAQQQAQVAPIIDAAKPQILAIHREAMEKTHAIMQSSVAQIRPLLTPEQQQKLDKLQQAHEKMREAMKELHEAGN
jgi:Spy/CpxP family protein refolding chaperone